MAIYYNVVHLECFKHIKSFIFGQQSISDLGSAGKLKAEQLNPLHINFYIPHIILPSNLVFRKKSLTVLIYISIEQCWGNALQL